MRDVANSGRFRTLLLGLFACALAVACHAPSPTPQPRQILRVARAFAPFSDRLTAEYRRGLPNVDVQTQAAGDSEAVIDAIQKGTADIGVVLASIAYSAYWDSRKLDPPSLDRVRGVSLLLPLPAYMLVRANSGIRQVEDLRGRSIGVGPVNSSSWILGRMVLNAFDAAPKTIKVMSTREEGATALKDGSVDAVVFPGYTYPDEVTYSAIRAGAYLIPIAGEPVERLRRDYPFVRVAAIPRDIYPGQNRIIPTVGIDMAVVCRRDLDEGVVHELTQQLFQTFPKLSGVEASLRFLNLDEAPATPVPLHPGAARYFREKELSR
jgi:TRAP transporter TAXI family solute receptor